jgi:multidrug efflux pump subunit AcrB
MPENQPRGVKRISAFSVILVMVVLMVVGAAMIPLLKVQYRPSENRNGFSVSFSYGGASARVVEQEVTSKLEGVLGSIDGVVNINANSRKGGGNVSLRFNKDTRIEVARFEAATQVRQLYDKLPAGVSYPYINMSLGGSTTQNILTYTINADLPPYLIVKYAEENLVPTLSRIEGLEGVSLSGATPFEWVVTFDAALVRNAGISTGDISGAFNSYFRKDIAGSFTEGSEMQTIRLKSTGGDDLGSIPVKKVNGRMYYLRDVATIKKQEMLPNSYFRINGLNTIYMNFAASEGINTIDVAKEVRETVEGLTPSLPGNYTLNLTYDSSTALKNELNTILFRSVLSLLILLAFVYVVSRSFRYLFLISLTIVVNLLVAVIFYYLFGVEIQLYSLAGITVSLGIIIDTSIVMIDHYSYYHNKKVFTSILGALLTTIAALLVIFFLPDNQKNNLVDFVWVIVINLSVSVVIAFLFIPSLLEKVPIKRRGVVKTRIKGRRRLVKLTHRYERFIGWGRRHRWVFIMVLVFGFGIPIQLLPDKVGKDENAEKTFVKLYNKTIGGTWYQDNKKIFETALGGSFRWFSDGYRPDMVFRQPEPRKSIDIYAGMPEGCTVHQLNEVIRAMENYLSQYDEIDMYQTWVNSFNNAHINVTFKKEFENTGFPLMLREEIIRQVNNFGGANWRVTGIVEQGFSNYVGSSGGWKNYGIRLVGYNYDLLYRYAELLVDSLSRNRRVSEPGIFSNDRYDAPENEFYISYDREKIARTGLNLGQYYGFLQQQLYDNGIGSVFDGKENIRVTLKSSEKDAFDLWHIQNDMIAIDTIQTRLNDVGSITMLRSGNNISRNNQEYQLVVGFNFVGAWELGNRVADNSVKMMNDEVLPIGHKASRISSNYRMTAKDNWRQAGLLLLVIVIIYSLCSVIFESLRKPFVILLMIPVGFIGLFLTFAIGKFTFDQGGFAAMVMMCGIVVNAGIYIVNEYNIIRRRSHHTEAVSVYVKAYNRKIIPTLLTIVSTVLGLIPFLFDGTDNVFWFAFAVGVMGSLIFSIIALVVYLPVFFPFKAIH